MATLKDIAKITGVSIKTVSRAVNNSGYVRTELKEKILAEAQRLGYASNRAARNLRCCKSDEVYVLSWAMDELFIKKFSAFEEEIRKEGFQVILVSMHDKDREYKEKILGQIFRERPLGVLLLTGRFYNVEETIEKFKEAKINFLQLDTPHNTACGIYIDRAAGVYDAVKYVATLTTGTIAYLGLAMEDHDWTRLQGYRDALTELGREQLEIFAPTAPSIFESGVLAAEIVAEKNIAAVQVYSDLLAMGLLYGLGKLGVVVPDDIMLLGFDNRDFSAYASPPLTTIAQPNAESGVLAAKVLLGLIKEEGCVQNPSFVIPTTLVVRDSTV